MNCSRCHEIWTVGRRHLTSGKFPFDIREDPIQDIRPTNGVSVNVGVQYLGEGGCPGLMLVSRCQGVRDAKSVVLRGVGLRATSFLSACRRPCRSRSSLNGLVSYEACHRSNDESSSGSGRVPVKAVSPVVPGAEASFSWCPVLPVNGLLEDKTKSPCGRGSIVVCSSRL